MKKVIKLTLFNFVFSLIYYGLHFTFSMAFDAIFHKTPIIFMSVCYIIISFVVFIFFGKLFKLENKNDYLKCYLTFCAISIILCVVFALFDIYLFVIFNTAPLFFEFEYLDLFFPIIDELELSTLVIMLIENTIKILALHLGAKLKGNQGTVRR